VFGQTDSPVDRFDSLWCLEVRVRPEERLAAVRAKGGSQKFVLFWGHRRERDGRAGWGCFSQWWPEPFVVDSVTYPTAEHWMMAEKARLFEDADGLAKVLAARSPGAAKAAGRLVRGFDENRWVQARYDIVVNGTLANSRSIPNWPASWIAPVRGSWWRPALPTGSGGSGWPLPTRAPRCRLDGAG
jgi:predicted NAD-dependent protein-ADP-ribosyltransferase YbiA (DUF1768 family)